MRPDVQAREGTRTLRLAHHNPDPLDGSEPFYKLYKKFAPPFESTKVEIGEDDVKGGTTLEARHLL